MNIHVPKIWKGTHELFYQSWVCICWSYFECLLQQHLYTIITVQKRDSLGEIQSCAWLLALSLFNPKGTLHTVQLGHWFSHKAHPCVLQQHLWFLHMGDTTGVELQEYREVDKTLVLLKYQPIMSVLTEQFGKAEIISHGQTAEHQLVYFVIGSNTLCCYHLL